MEPEEMLILEAEDVTTAVCICVLIVSTVVALFFFPRIDILSPLAQRNVSIVPELAMVGTKNPFSLRILEANSTSIKEGIRLQIQTSVCSEVHSLWAVEYSSLHEALKDDSSSLLQDAARSLDGHFLHCDSPVVLDADSATVMHLRLPDRVTDTHIQATMGPPPRTKYPLCLVIRSLEGDSLVSSQCRIAGAVYILHLKDDVFPERCRIIAQLIISETGQVWDLQKLYMAGDDDCVHTSQNNPASNDHHGDGGTTPNPATPNPTTPNPATRDPTTENTNADRNPRQNDLADGLCVVCQNGLIEIALLPCRHACICTSCFPLVNRCPMCRGYIASFFPLRCGGGDLERTHYNEEEEEEDWAMRFNNTCERFNRWLGFES